MWGKKSWVNLYVTFVLKKIKNMKEINLWVNFICYFLLTKNLKYEEDKIYTKVNLYVT